jgi:polyhydroxyalkanoate synthesis regulator phasin
MPRYEQKNPRKLSAKATANQIQREAPPNSTNRAVEVAKTAKATSNSYRWTEEQKRKLVNTLVENPELFRDKASGAKTKHIHILNALPNGEGFDELKVSQKWESIHYQIEALKKAYKTQKERFNKTGEGPSAKERAMGAQSLRGESQFHC